MPLWRYAVGCLLASALSAQTVISPAEAPKSNAPKQLAYSETAVALELAPMAGPTLGYVFDPTWQAVRRLEGLAGIAVLRETNPLEVRLREAWPAPQHDYLLGAAAADGRVVVLFTSRGLLVGHEDLPLADRSPDRVAFSPSGQSAALYYEDSRQVLLFRDLPQNPAEAGRWELSAWPGAVTDLAVSDAAAGVLLAVTEPESGVLLVLAEGVEPRSLFAMAKPSSVAFLAASADAVAADSEGNEVLLIRDVFGAAQPETMLGAAEGLDAPEQVSVDSENRLFTIRQKDSNAVLVWDRQLHHMQRAFSPLVPSLLEPLNARRVYQLTPPLAGTMLILDASGVLPVITAVQGAYSSPLPVAAPCSDCEQPSRSRKPQGRRVVAP